MTFWMSDLEYGHFLREMLWVIFLPRPLISCVPCVPCGVVKATSGMLRVTSICHGSVNSGTVLKRLSQVCHI